MSFFMFAKKQKRFPGHVRRDITGLAHRSENLRTEKRLYRYRKNEGKHILTLTSVNNVFVKPFAYSIKC